MTRVLTLRRAAELAGVSHQAIAKAIARGALRAVDLEQTGGALTQVVRPRDLDRWIGMRRPSATATG